MALSLRRGEALSASHVLLCGLLVLSALLPAHAVLFEVAATDRDCFFVPINTPKMSINGRYESFLGNDSVHVTVAGPVTPPDPKLPTPPVQSKTLFTSKKESAPFKVLVPTTGFYQICVMNALSYSQTVTLNFHVAPIAASEGASAPGSSQRPPDVNQLVMSSQTDELKSLSEQVLEMANGLFEQQSNSLARMAIHEQLGTSTQNRASLWKLVQMCSQIVLSLIHIYAVRSHFEVKTIV
ncbi:hypothetical protein BESB_036140 [Besnoitia besnoiti]|uniref:GOLD domain-containing protein n=1 Tax=Besnoitia besnoiti TaxID=94643 RepID=A0A2A9MM47_BESBE|nr:hypothetical protein BESB_036140 [Besnoitia besnoiti]PFH37156.1 hypothetical protein BESB_036140 [Besnoitia besnoiti]